MMIDCLYAQVLKGSPPVGETPEAIAEELAVQKRIEVVSPFSFKFPPSFRDKI